jgi:hypothetical protein
MIVADQINFLIFFWDPLEPMPHDPDVKALLRMAAVWNIPIACNRASADFMISSPLMDGEYVRLVPDYGTYRGRSIPDWQPPWRSRSNEAGPPIAVSGGLRTEELVAGAAHQSLPGRSCTNRPPSHGCLGEVLHPRHIKTVRNLGTAGPSSPLLPPG